MRKNKSILTIIKVNRKIAFAVLGVILMVIPAGSILGLSFQASPHNVKASLNTGSDMKNILQGERFQYNRIGINKHESGKTSSGNSFLPLGPKNTGFNNITGVFNSDSTGYSGISDVSTTGTYIGIIPVVNNAQDDQVIIYDSSNSTYSNYTSPGFNFYNIIPAAPGFISGAVNEETNQLAYFYITSDSINQVNFTGLNSSMVQISGVVNKTLIIDYFPSENRNTSYIYEATYSGNILYNITRKSGIPEDFQMEGLVDVNGTVYFGGYIITNNSTTATLQYALISMNLTNFSFTYLEKWGGITENLGDKNVTFLSMNLFDYRSMIYIETSQEMAFYSNNIFYYLLTSEKSALSEYSIASKSFSNLSLAISKYGLFVGNAIYGNTALIVQQNYGNDSSSDIPDDAFYLLNMTSNSLTNITSIFGDHYPFESLSSIGSDFYIGEYEINTMFKIQSSMIIDFNASTETISYPAFSPEPVRVSDAPTAWVSQSTAGDGGIMTVGGDGFVFYNSTGFYSVGNISNNGFLLGAAWNGNEFMLVGQKYFTSGGPEEGVLAYLYYPQNGTLIDLSSIFGSSLELNATLFSVSNASGNFLIAGIRNLQSGNDPLLYVYDPVNGSLMNISDDLPVDVNNVQMGETASSGSYAYVSYYYDQSIYLASYYNGKLVPFQTIENSLIPFSPVIAWRSNFLSADGGNVFTFGYDSADNQFVSYYEYNVSQDQLVKNGQEFVGSDTYFSYVMSYAGNPIVLGDYSTSSQSVNAIALALNSSDHVFSYGYRFINGLEDSVYSASDYNGNIFIASGSEPQVYYGIWNVTFSSFQTSIFNITYVRGSTGNGVSKYAWSVSLTNVENDLFYSNNTNGSSLSLSLQEGNYSYVISAAGVYNEKGFIDINSSRTIDLTFPALYNVVFKEKNLPVYANWSLNMFGKTISHIDLSAQSPGNISFLMYNGTFDYYTGYIYKGTSLTMGDKETLNITGSNTSLTVVFPVTLNATIIAENIPTGTYWGLSVFQYKDNYTLSYYNSTNYTEMTAYLPSGSYEAQYAIFSYSGQQQFNISASSLDAYIKFPSLYPLYTNLTNAPFGDHGFRGWFLASEYGNYNVENKSNSAPIYLVNGTYSFFIILVFRTPEMDYDFPISTFNVTINGSSTSVTEKIPELYNVTFNFVGIPSNLNVTMNFGVSKELNNYLEFFTGTLETTNGTTFGYFPDGSYSANINSGGTAGFFNFNVSGTAETLTENMYDVSVSFNGLYCKYSGLTSIGGRINYGIQQSLSYYMPDGTFNVQAEALFNGTRILYSGNLTVNGRKVNLEIDFPDHYYRVNVTELGLPLNQYWNLYAKSKTGNLTICSSVDTSLQYGIIYLSNGTYGTIENSQYPYHSNLSSITVSGKNETVYVGFNSDITYAFLQSGLPEGVQWSMVIGGVKYDSTGQAIEVNVAIGQNLSFSVLPPGGYTSTPNNGVISQAYPFYLYNSGELRTDYIFNFTVTFISVFNEKYGYINKTLIADNNTIMNGDYAAFTTQNGTVAGAYDPQNGIIYATFDSLYGSSLTTGIYLINATSYRIQKTVVLSHSAYFYGIIYDKQNGNVYVDAINSANSSQIIIELNTTTNVIDKVETGSGILGYQILLAPDSNEIYAPVQNGLVVINPDNLTIVKNINIDSSGPSLYSGFRQLVYSNVTGDIYVSGYGTNLTVINPMNNEIVKNISLDLSANSLYFDEIPEIGSMTYDYLNNNIYLEVISVNSREQIQNSTIDVISLSRNEVTGNFSVPRGIGISMAFNPSLNVLWVANQFVLGTNTYSTTYSGQVYEVNLSNNKVIQDLDSGYGSASILLVNQTSTAFVFNSLSGSVSVIKERTTQIATYNVTFKEQGLSSGTEWSATLNGMTKDSTSSSIIFLETNGSYSFTIGSVSDYIASPSSGTVNVSGTNILRTITFSLRAEANYTVLFNEKGLPSGMEWNLTFLGEVYHLTNTSYKFLLVNGSYVYSVGQISGYTLETMGSFTVSGSGVTVNIDFIKNATLHVKVSPASALFTVNGKVYPLSSGYAVISISPGYYFLNVSETGYYTYTNLFDFGSLSYSINISLKPLVSYGQLKGSVYPGNSIISANGILISVSNGSYDQDLSPGTYIISASANGYVSSNYEVNITLDHTAYLNITLSKSSRTYTVSGYVNPVNASVMFNSFMSYVNSTGYFEISLPSGNYTISVTSYGYFAMTGSIDLKSNLTLYFNLIKEPTPTSVSSSSNITASGYNVTVSNLAIGVSNLSLKYNASSNGTISVVLPYSELKNVTVADLLNSTVYVNGVQYRNFSVALSASNGTFSAILTVYGLNGDPVLIWAYSPSFVLHKSKPASGFNPLYFEIGSILAITLVIIGTVAYVRRKRR